MAEQKGQGTPTSEALATMSRVCLDYLRKVGRKERTLQLEKVLQRALRDAYRPGDVWYALADLEAQVRYCVCGVGVCGVTELAAWAAASRWGGVSCLHLDPHPSCSPYPHPLSCVHQGRGQVVGRGFDEWFTLNLSPQPTTSTSSSSLSPPKRRRSEGGGLSSPIARRTSTDTRSRSPPPPRPQPSILEAQIATKGKGTPERDVLKRMAEICLDVLRESGGKARKANLGDQCNKRMQGYKGGDVLYALASLEQQVGKRWRYSGGKVSHRKLCRTDPLNPTPPPPGQG